MRDDFPPGVKGQVAARVGYLCSNPACRQSTSGPSATEKAVTNVGVAAHITAASPDGPRFDATLTPEQRRATENALWLCQRCGKAVDDDAVTYTCEVLRGWKEQAEAEARRAIERGPKQEQPQHVNAAVYLGPNAVNISGHRAVVLGPNAIHVHGPVVGARLSLSPEARQLLLAASRDEQGAVLVYTTFGGMFVRTAGQDFCESKNPRSEARWRAVIQELRRAGLIEQTDSEGHVFSLTDAGYSQAEAPPDPADLPANQLFDVRPVQSSGENFYYREPGEGEDRFAVGLHFHLYAKCDAQILNVDLSYAGQTAVRKRVVFDDNAPETLDTSLRLLRRTTIARDTVIDLRISGDFVARLGTSADYQLARAQLELASATWKGFRVLIVSGRLAPGGGFEDTAVTWDAPK